MADKKNMRFSPKKYKRPKWILFPICIAFIAAIVLAVMLKISNLVPQKYFLAGSLVLGLLLLLTLIFYLIKSKKTAVISCVMSILIAASCGLGIWGVNTAMSAINSIGNANYKIDNMVVSVGIDDPAETIYDTIDYTFGYQNTIDVENTQTMITEIETLLGQPINLVEYDSIINLGQALVDNQVHAIIYNESFDATIAEMVENFSSKVRILYEHGIKVELPTPSPTPTPNADEPEVCVTPCPEVNSFSMFLSGIDTYGSINKTSRSDVNLIVTVNADTKEVLITSTPRDTYLVLPGISGTTKDKLTHAGNYGVDVSIATLEEYYGINIDYYSRINFSSLIKIVDSIGGVDVYSDYSFSTDSGHSFSKGMNNLTGKEALAFARERHSFTSGDFQRGKNQQALIEAIINKALEPSTLVKVPEIIASLSDSVQTSMTTSDITDLVNMQLDDGASWSISSQNLEGTTGSSYCYSLGSNASVVYGNEDSKIAVANKINEVMTNTVN